MHNWFRMASQQRFGLLDFVRTRLVREWRFDKKRSITLHLAFEFHSLTRILCFSSDPAQSETAGHTFSLWKIFFWIWCNSIWINVIFKADELCHHVYIFNHQKHVERTHFMVEVAASWPKAALGVFPKIVKVFLQNGCFQTWESSDSAAIEMFPMGRKLNNFNGKGHHVCQLNTVKNINERF